MFAWNAVLPCATAADADNGHKASANIDNPKGWGRQPDPPHNTATSGIFEIRSFTLQFQGIRGAAQVSKSFAR
jgi:hypothetical protein